MTQLTDMLRAEANPLLDAAETIDRLTAEQHLNLAEIAVQRGTIASLSADLAAAQARIAELEGAAQPDPQPEPSPPTDPEPEPEDPVPADPEPQPEPDPTPTEPEPAPTVPAPVPSGETPPPDLVVSSQAELLGALPKATGGERIAVVGRLAATTIKGLSFASKVRITSADPQAPAVFDYLELSGCAGIALEGLEVAFKAASGMACLKVVNSSGIDLIGNYAHGAEGRSAPVGSPTHGIWIDASSDVVAQGNRAHWAVNGMMVMGSDGVDLIENDVDNLGADGLKFTDSHHLRVLRNLLQRHSWTSPTAHNDGMQFQLAPCSWVEIVGNVLLPENDFTIQPIWISGNEGRQEHFLIEENILYSSMLNGITVDATGGAGDIVIRRNDVLLAPGNHSASKIAVSGNVPGIVIEENITAGSAYAEGKNLTLTRADYARVFEGDFSGPITPADLRRKPGGPGERYGARARLAELLAA